MAQTTVFLFFQCFSLLSFVTATRIPRGVSPTNRNLYEQAMGGDSFACFDGTAFIRLSQVNDDYCDCADASDEPGTSACNNGFYVCLNEGYRPKKISSSMVNDGICDCCDGSDEYSGFVTCANGCVQLGEEMRRIEFEKRLEQQQGWEERVKLAAGSRELAVITEEGLASLRVKLEQAQPALSSALEAKTKAEEAELSKKKEFDAAHDESVKVANDLFHRSFFDFLDADNNELVDMGELQSHVELDLDADSLVSEAEVAQVLTSQAAVSPSPTPMGLRRHDPRRIHDEDGDEAEELPVEEDEIEENAEEEEEVFDEGAPEGEGSAPSSSSLVPSIPEKIDFDAFGAFAPRLYERLKGKAGDNFSPMPDSTRPPYPESINSLIQESAAAREEYERLNDEKETTERDMGEKERRLAVDHGPDRVFFALHHQCLEYRDHEYVYKVCFFDKVTQDSVHGHRSTNLGEWSGWENAPPHTTMMYKGGERCWNGPDRSTKVLLECGSKSEIFSVAEPNRCEYVMRMRTPGVCVAPAPHDEHAFYHEEL